MKCAGYLRVSTGEQTTDNQLPAIRQWCASRGYELSEIYQENESAWRSGHQHELSRLLADIRSGKRKYDYLVIWSLDRLCRSGIGPIFSLIASFRRYGCQVVSCNESWLETSGPATDLLIAVTKWIAEFESHRRSERVKAGLARIREDGKRINRRGKDKKPRRTRGYIERWNKDKKTSGEIYA
jgi:putative DNA-invertase from lambdoid prophage Rac